MFDSGAIVSLGHPKVQRLPSAGPGLKLLRLDTRCCLAAKATMDGPTYWTNERIALTCRMLPLCRPEIDDLTARRSINLGH